MSPVGRDSCLMWLGCMHNMAKMSLRPSIALLGEFPLSCTNHGAQDG